MVLVDQPRELRSRLMAIAYRMLRSVADAEDAVQDAFVRLHTAAEVTSPEGYLVRTTTRLCIDELRRRRRRQMQSEDAWIGAIDAKNATPDVDTLQQAFVLLLERLTPQERAAFLLRCVFDYAYVEIAELLEQSEVHVRQLVCRAKAHLAQGRARFQCRPKLAERLAEQFVATCRSPESRVPCWLATSTLHGVA